MISAGYQNPLYDGTMAAINPVPPRRDQPPDHPAADSLTKLTVPSAARVYGVTSEDFGIRTAAAASFLYEREVDAGVEMSTRDGVHR